MSDCQYVYPEGNRCGSGPFEHVHRSLPCVNGRPERHHKYEYSEGDVSVDIERALAERLEAAELVCLMVGWSAADNSQRGKARHELWRAWRRLYEGQGGSILPKDHPELSDDRIRALADERDGIVAATLAKLHEARG